ncbi:carbohydrate kinase family protein [Clostridium lundense]|uniref:carbohydrate kinase family protein n=1 Tax=Clostridium lundense TaxID=319475 RepID=UPI00047FA44A|nr:carbohydrate kinase [Clostridium lundense]
MYDVVALGELLIDFTPNGKSEKGCNMFEQNPGGAPANVLALLAKLGKKTAFIGKVGEDQFGLFLKNTLKNLNIDTTGLALSKEFNTTLAFVHLNDNGDRTFSFYRNPGADMMLTKDELRLDLIYNTKIFHFGSLSLTKEPAISATFKALDYAKAKDKLISYDPNLRPALWDNLDFAKAQITKGLYYADILKVSEEELLFITDISDMEKATRYLLDNYDIKFIFVTLGEKGCFYRYGDNYGIVEPFKVTPVDTTGAGDSFLGAVLYKLMDKDINNLPIDELIKIVRFASAVGALVTTKRGSLSIMPDLNSINNMLNK